MFCSLEGMDAKCKNPPIYHRLTCNNVYCKDSKRLVCLNAHYIVSIRDYRVKKSMHLTQSFYLLRCYNIGSVCCPELGTWGIFFIFSIIKNVFFYQVNSLFLHQSYWKILLPVKLTWQKNPKNNFLLLNKFKITSSARLCLLEKILEATWPEKAWCSPAIVVLILAWKVRENTLPLIARIRAINKYNKDKNKGC